MKGKHLKKVSWTKKKMISAILSVSLLLGCVYSASMAWLTDDDQPIVNIFQSNQLEITFGNEENEYLLVPGATYRIPDNQVPKVVLNANSVDCYLVLMAEFYFYDLAKAITTENGYGVDDVVFNTPAPIRQMESLSYLNHDSDDNDYGYLVTNNHALQQYARNIIPIYDEQGALIGRRFFYLYTPNGGDNNNAVFEKSSEDRFLYIMDGGETDCKFEVNDQLTKEQVHPDARKDKEPKMVFTAFAIQAIGSANADRGTNAALNMVVEGIYRAKGNGGYMNDAKYEWIKNDGTITIQ